MFSMFMHKTSVFPATSYVYILYFLLNLHHVAIAEKEKNATLYIYIVHFMNMLSNHIAAHSKTNGTLIFSVLVYIKRVNLLSINSKMLVSAF